MPKVDESIELKPYNRSQQKIPTKILDLILGKDTTVDSRTGSGVTKSGKKRKLKPVQKKTVLKRGRADPGPENPRGARTGRSLKEQLAGRVGELPDVVGRERVHSTRAVEGSSGSRSKEDIRNAILQLILEEEAETEE